MWAEIMRGRFGARDERSWKLRFHAQTAGCTLTWQQPYNNVVRTAYQALAAVLGGAQSLHTNSLDEALALPSEDAVTLALRTQQILAHETGVPSEPDPLGGSHYVEALTVEMEQQALALMREIDDLGGMIPAIEQGYPQSKIAQASYEYQRSIESKEQIVVGVNAYQQTNEPPIPILRMDDTPERQQCAKLADVRARRNAAQVRSALSELTQAVHGHSNTMPYILGAVRASATVGEICEALRGVFGQYQESSAF
jgi:methylmalonyl-CoA mutase N-terminal domain/subunit